MDLIQDQNCHRNYKIERKHPSLAIHLIPLLIAVPVNLDGLKGYHKPHYECADEIKVENESQNCIKS